MTVVAWALPRASRVAMYQSELSNHATLANVSGAFTDLSPRAGTPPVEIDLGYAALRIDDEPLSLRQPRPGVAEIVCQQGRIVAFAPFRWRGRNGVWDPVIGVVGAGDDPAHDPFSAIAEDLHLGPDFEGAAGFEWNAAVVRTDPVPMPGVWAMDDPAFSRLFVRTLFKAMDAANQRGGRVIDAPEARSIVRFGSPSRPGRVHVAVWSPRGDLTHGLMIDSDSAQWSRRAAHAIASSWRPMIEDAPRNHKELARLIHRALQGELSR